MMMKKNLRKLAVYEMKLHNFYITKNKNLTIN